MNAPLESYAEFLSSLNEKTVDRFTDYVVKDVLFRDPFNEVCGADRMMQIFTHMYRTIGSVKFDILHHAMMGDVGLLHWRFTSTLRGKPWSFEGMSHIRFDSDGRVVAHIDHWDAAREFYEHFPVVGWALKTIRRKISLEK